MEETYKPASQAYVLSSGRKVMFSTPDLYAMARGSGGIPNIVAATIFDLLYRGRRDVDPAQLFLNDQQHTQKLFNALQAIMEPRLKLDDDDEEGVVGRKEVNLADLGAGYSFLLYGPPRAAAVSEPLVSAQPPPPEDASK